MPLYSSIIHTLNRLSTKTTLIWAKKSFRWFGTPRSTFKHNPQYCYCRNDFPSSEARLTPPFVSTNSVCCRHFAAQARSHHSRNTALSGRFRLSISHIAEFFRSGFITPIGQYTQRLRCCKIYNMC